MKKILIVFLLISFCGGEEANITVASDIIPKSQVIWCNNSLDKLKSLVDATKNNISLASQMSEAQYDEIVKTANFFSATARLFFNLEDDVSSRLIYLVSAQLNTNLDEYPNSLESLQKGADFCTSWYQAQNS